MAMHQQMRLPDWFALQRTAEFQQLRHVKPLRWQQFRFVLYDVMEPQFQFGVFAIRAKFLRHRPFRIQYGKHMADFGVPMQVKLCKPAYGYSKGQCHAVQLSRVAPRVKTMKNIRFLT